MVVVFAPLAGKYGVEFVPKFALFALSEDVLHFVLYLYPIAIFLSLGKLVDLPEGKG